MRRFIGELIDDNIQIVDKGEIKHILKVNRLKTGDSIEVLVNDVCFECGIVEIDKKKILCKKVREIHGAIDYNVTLIVSMIKENKIRELIRHSVELGVNEIIITNTKRSSIKMNSSKIQKYEKIIMESLKQSKSFIKTALSYRELSDIDFKMYEDVLILHTDGKGQKIKNVKNNSALFIGPEGGFDNDEIIELINKGCKCVSLGENILRAETAVVSGISIFLHEMDVM